MAIPAPEILLPSGGDDYTTDVATQTISGTTSGDTSQVRVNGSTNGVSYTPGETAWAWTGDVSLGENVLEVTAIERVTGLESNPTVIRITLVQDDDFITVSAPTGVRVRRYQDQIEPVCSKNPEEGVAGYNFYVSYQSGGVNNSYAKMNTQLVTEESFYEDSVTEIGRTVDQVGEIRVTTITDEVKRNFFYSYFFNQTVYNRLVAAGSLPDVGFNQDVPFYFVITAVIYDSVSGKVTESTYSPELEGNSLTITTGIQDLPERTQSDIILTYSQELLASNSGVDTKPGTVLRDIIDPISEEEARLYVIQDFLARSLSVTGLLDFDDANGDGESDAVSSSTAKRALQVALNLTNEADVQQVIDDQFDKLGANVNVRRRGAQPATGSVVFYTETAPIRDMVVNEGAVVSTTGDLDQGIPAQNYRTLATRVLSFSDRDSFYNTSTERYELEVDVEATDSGEDTNTDSYTIRTVSSGADSDFLVENPNPISFGVDQESNHDMATRIQLAFFTDTGTEGGYARVAVSVPGVRGVRVEKAKDPLMRRDYDPIREEHIGGKVDIYIQGSKDRQLTDQIAFAFASVAATEGTQSGEVFTVINATSYQFQSQNPRVTAHTPIFEVTKVTNATRGSDYDITGYQIIGDGDTIDLDETLATNANIGLASTDVIRVDYKFRSSDTFILQNQPVDEIVSVTGQLSDALTTDNYELVKLQDTLEEGGSTIAQDGLRIKFANNLPVTDFQEITDEEHVLIEEIEEPLDFLGADPESIVVKNSAGTTTYVRDVDYTVNPGTETTATTIELIPSGGISSGQTVLVSYNAIENFTIVYRNNGLLADVQTEVDDTKHACADVIVKGAVENSVDFIITVIPKAGVTNLDRLSSQIRTAVSNFISQLGVGVSLTQSDVDSTIRSVDDVDYVVLPFIKMVKADGSFIVRDDLGSPTFEIYNEGVSTAYITTNPVLTYNTIDKGGSENLFRGVFEDTMPLVLQDDPLDVSGGSGRAYIQSDGKIIVSTRDGNLPDTHEYKAAYYVYGESGSEDINVASVEYLRVGLFSINYDTPRTLNRQAF